ncbi:16S rRNA (guanine(966)-N(2))-methyltransferase RsmD [candidate division KSB1 bacterium]|nr:16S rRNA (guanine(966)-N(2))-methyltransferase RsmD [candidate division KSB1 bacterium]RQW00665.1 MAG: 16S rRNA (guanine(966)-N(2))-methyltransferase RsmD [candidate division KSB1 bacterium]
MRIIAGAFKGARLYTPKSIRIRPTSDRVREYIFSCIQTSGSAVLDLFAGTGALGIEALSRGAEEVLFVDSSKDAVNLISKNLLKVHTRATVLKNSAESFLKKSKCRFDFIFCDPPYDYQRFDVIMSLVVQNRLLHNEGLMIYESSSRQNAPTFVGLVVTRQKKIGDTLITFYKENYENSNLSGDI